MSNSKKWRYNSVCQLHWLLLSSDHNKVLFNEASGKTHLVSLLCAETMSQLQHQALDHREICRILSQRHDLDLDEVLEGYVERMLIDLDGLGLIEPCES